jgi:hypothetical protein
MSIKIDAGEWHATMATGSQTAKQGLAARQTSADTQLQLCPRDSH